MGWFICILLRYACFRLYSILFDSMCLSLVYFVFLVILFYFLIISGPIISAPARPRPRRPRPPPNAERIYVETLAAKLQWPGVCKEKQFLPIPTTTTMMRNCGHMAYRHLYWAANQDGTSFDAPYGPEPIPCDTKEHTEHSLEKTYSRLRSFFASRSMSSVDHEYAARRDGANMSERCEKKRHLKPNMNDIYRDGPSTREAWLQVDAEAMRLAAALFSKCLVKTIDGRGSLLVDNRSPPKF